MSLTSSALPISAVPPPGRKLGCSAVPDLTGIAERLELRDHQRDAVRAALENRGALPVPMTRLDRLPAKRTARRLLREFGLDADRVGRSYGVGYCDDVEERIARDRIVVPVRRRDEVCGWMALVVADGDQRGPAAGLRARFLSAPGMRASELVYNLDRAREYATGVIVDTPLDVWRFGPMAMSLPGDLASDRQLRSIRSAFRRGSVILLVDQQRRGRHSVRQIVSFLERVMLRQFAIVELPRSHRATSRSDLRALVFEQAARRGIEISYRKRDRS